MRYRRPEVGDHKLVYRGRRYWVLEIAAERDFEGINKDICDYVVWDCLDDGIIALLKKCLNGKLSGAIIAHVDMATAEFDNFKEASNKLSKKYDYYIRETH